MKNQKIINDKYVREIRASKRVHGFLTATVEAFGEVWPVRLKNISLTGALINAPARLPIGTMVTLNRLHMSISAVVVREGKNYLGLNFNEPLLPEEINLLRAGAYIAKPKLITEQSNDPYTSPRANKSPLVSGLRPSRFPLEGRLAKELQYAQSLLETAIEPIINNHLLLQRYGRNLQELDSISQLLGYAAKIMATEDKECAINQIDDQELRLRLKGEPVHHRSAKKQNAG
jgi:hypothetical protein